MKRFTYIKITMLFLVLFCMLIPLIINSKNLYLKNKEKELLENITNLLDGSTIKKERNELFENGEIGIIIIPSIGIKAPIYEGTSNEILKYSIGHFEETSLWQGNVALASHNRGSYAHYFSRIDELEKDEEIIYITNMGERRYKVTESKIISETNVDILKDTKENIITLITCVTGRKNKRRCVIGKQEY